MTGEFDGLGALFGDMSEGPFLPAEGTVQDIRRDMMFDNMLKVSQAAEVAAGLVFDIVEEHEGRMQLDEKGHLLIVGRLAIYRVDVNAFMEKFVNPFGHNSFDVVEVHPNRAGQGTPEPLVFRCVHRRTCPPTTSLLVIFSV